MSRIMIINIDSKIPNLALAKIKKYYLDKGDEVIENIELFKNIVDKTYVSCVFAENKNKCNEYLDYPNVSIGGTGWDLTTKLPPEIDEIKPKINFGFTMRGCIRKCPFCVVPIKEGFAHVVGDIYDIWDGQSKRLTIMDNNILALPEHFFKICSQLKKEKISVDFNQGLDHRLLTNDICKELKSLRHWERFRFSFDHKNFDSIKKSITMLKDNNIKSCFWYVLVGFQTTFLEDLEKLNYLKSEGQYCYVQTFNNKPELRNDLRYQTLNAWVNAFCFFQNCTFKEYLETNCPKFKDKILQGTEPVSRYN